MAQKVIAKASSKLLRHHWLVLGALLLVGTASYADAAVHLRLATPPIQKVTATKKTTARPQPAPVKPVAPVAVTPPSPPVTAVKSPASVIVHRPTVTTAAKPAPVVTPAPNSAVNNLTPTTPTPASPPSPPPSSGSTGSGSSTPPQTTSYSSTNWSGYLAANGSFSAVSAAWTVPTVTGNGSTTSADGTWIGIGGVSANDLIQIGTSDTVSASGTVSSEAFYEMLPAVSQTVPGVTVSPGDAISASITQLSSNQWALYLIDQTTGQSYSQTVSYSSSNSSAEWIEEDPSYSNGHQIPFDNYGSVTFTSGLTTMNGSALNLTGANAQPVTMVDSHTGAAVSTPSSLSSNGSSFSVSRN